jgi:hypothetical protein
MEIKAQLLEKCKVFVENRLQNIQETIASNQNALTSEVKSSAGDKHETGRAMLQLEIEKASQQLIGVAEMKTVLSRIDVSKTTSLIHLGSIVYTNFGNFFLSISAGKFTVENDVFFAVSISSPIGKLLLGKKENDTFSFNGKNYNIILRR